MSLDFLGGASGKEPVCQCRRRKICGSIPGSGRSPGVGNGSPLQYSCLGKLHRQRSLAGYSSQASESDTTELMNTHTHTHTRTHTHTHTHNVPSTVSIIFVVVIQSLNRIQLFATPWTVAHQAPLFFIITYKYLFIYSVILLYKVFYFNKMSLKKKLGVKK